jgi:hypothetical protein
MRNICNYYSHIAEGRLPDLRGLFCGNLESRVVGAYCFTASDSCLFSTNERLDRGQQKMCHI